jgi:perosamine synthetase
MKSELAIYGGEKTKTTPFGSGKRFGLDEALQVMEALEQNTLFYHFGNKVKTFLNTFNEMYGVSYSVATSSGTAAIHVALGAAGVTEGDEVITSPITDQGTIIGILYQNAVPVFADVCPTSYNMTAKEIEKKITPRTKAIIVVHLAGNPCEMDGIMELAKKYNLIVIEDCAQSYLATYKGKLTGTIGDYGCFSTNDFKHISTGDGGIVTVNSGNEDDYRKAHAFADKNYQRLGTDVDKDISFLAPNYRMTELQGAVGIAQLKKLHWICEQRNQYGMKLQEKLSEIEGIIPASFSNESYSTFWFYMFRVEEAVLGCSRDEFSKALEAEGIPNGAGYIPQVIYKLSMFQKKEAYLGSHTPFQFTKEKYEEGDCPNAEMVLKTAVRLNINEFYTDADLEETCEAIQKVATYFLTKKRLNV